MKTSPDSEAELAEAPPARKEPDAQLPEPAPLLHSEALLQGHKRVHIAHNGAYYQLQTTRQGKLILTK